MPILLVTRRRKFFYITTKLKRGKIIEKTSNLRHFSRFIKFQSHVVWQIFEPELKKSGFYHKSTMRLSVPNLKKIGDGRLLNFCNFKRFRVE